MMSNVPHVRKFAVIYFSIHDALIVFFIEFYDFLFSFSLYLIIYHHFAEWWMWLYMQDKDEMQS